MTMKLSFTPLNRIASAIFVAVCVSSPALALDLPAALQYKGKPIEPYCFTNEEQKKLDVKQCMESNWKQTIETRPASWKKDDSLGYEYKEIGEDGDYSFISYRYVGHLDNSEVILIESSGGGTGFFSSLVGVIRKEDILIYGKRYAAGDKCNGGISKAFIKNGSLVTEQAITPADFYALSAVAPPNGLKSYNVLSSHHNGCLGTARKINGEFVAFLPPTDENKKTGFFSYYLDKESKHNTTTSKSDNYDECFFNLYAGVPEQAEWTPVQMKEFMTHFNRSCIEHK